MKQKVVPSEQTQQEAMKIAKATQKPGQTKEQTKLVAQGIEKGIAQYKKQQKEKSRQADKAKKKLKKQRQAESADNMEVEMTEPRMTTKSSKLPWILLALSWIGFALFFINGR